MQGLLRRGMEIRRRIQANVDLTPENGQQDDSISQEDQEEILKQIDSIAAANRIAVSPETFEVNPIHRRAYFPLVVNVTAVLVLALGLLGLYRFFQAGEREAGRAGSSYVSGEARLIRRLQEESEERLAAKEQEIGAIQSRLRELDAERRALEANLETEIESREEALRREFQARLAAERQRLEQEGVSQEEIQAQLQSLQSEGEAELQEALQLARREAEAERARLESNLTALEQEYDQALADAREEQASILRETESEYRRQVAASEQRLSDAMARLDRLSTERAREDRAREQIAGYYDLVRRSMRDGRYDEATTALSQLRSFLFEPAVESIPAIVERRPTEVFVVDSLLELVEEERTAAEIDTPALLASAQHIAAVSELVSDARAARERGDPAAAASAYEAALGVLPESEEAHRYLSAKLESSLNEALSAAQAAYENQVETIRAEATREAAEAREEADERLSAALAAASAEAQARTQAAVTTAVAEARREVERLFLVRESALQAEIESLETELAQARTAATRVESENRRATRALTQAEAEVRLAESRASDLADELSAIRSGRAALSRRFEEFASRLSAREVSAPPGDELASIATMLDTKVNLRRVLATEFVRSQYPNLYEEMDVYLDALASESAAEARRQALADFELILGSLSSETGDGVAALPDYFDRESVAILSRLLEKIDRLVLGSAE